jgi:hypothetical protein
MTEDKDFKKVVRDRAAKTGERYSTARKHLTARDSDERLVLVRDELASSVRNFWTGFRPSLRGLTDDEYLWQPTPGCPTIHRQQDGTYRVDHQFPIEGAASIAQRLGWAAQTIHVATNQHFGDKSITREHVGNVSGTAPEGVAFLSDAVSGWGDGLAACEPSFLLEHSENLSPGAIDGQFPFIAVVMFYFELLVQSCAHVSMTRDLYLKTHPEIVGSR